jgi:hypothetical protein
VGTGASDTECSPRGAVVNQVWEGEAEEEVLRALKWVQNCLECSGSYTTFDGLERHDGVLQRIIPFGRSCFLSKCLLASVSGYLNIAL